MVRPSKQSTSTLSHQGSESSHARNRCPLLSRQWLQGRIFPSAFSIAAPSALLAVLVKVLERHLEVDQELVNVAQLNGSVFTAFSTLVSFVVVFRTSHSHQRFAQGVSFVYHMLSDWAGAASSIIALSTTQADSQESRVFRHSMVRMISLLNALMLAELAVDDDLLVEGRALDLEVLDVEGLDMRTLSKLRGTSRKAEVVFQWIQVAVMDHLRTGVGGLPAPIVTRAFLMLGSGMHHFHQCKQLTQVPWPFPYTQTTKALLIMHWFVTPVCMGAWTDSALWACIFTLIQVFVCWALYGIAVELENPFDDGQDDIDLASIQKSLNETLLALVHPDANSPPEGKLCEAFECKMLHHRCTRETLRSVMVGTSCGSESPVNSMFSPLSREVSKKADSPNGASGSEVTGGELAYGSEAAAHALQETTNMCAVPGLAARAFQKFPPSSKAMPEANESPPMHNKTTQNFRNTNRVLLGRVVAPDVECVDMHPDESTNVPASHGATFGRHIGPHGRRVQHSCVVRSHTVSELTREAVHVHEYDSGTQFEGSQRAELVDPPGVPLPSADTGR